mmetsp:Transcript_19068/g.53139  ORF Transcript_19068/g.53139 Transcript_19068/m.53139 type:complete len:118 (-) Transcript_19068:879-1232(-)
MSTAACWTRWTSTQLSSGIVLRFSAAYENGESQLHLPQRRDCPGNDGYEGIRNGMDDDGDKKDKEEGISFLSALRGMLLCDRSHDCLPECLHGQPSSPSGARQEVKTVAGQRQQRRR